MSIGDFSSVQDPESDAFHCTPGHIPIIPVRFSLQPYDNLTNPAKPTGITSPGDYILRKIRQGFVYIFIEAPTDTKGATSGDGTWYNFRYSTSTQDANSAVSHERVETKDAGEGKYQKYEWTENYGRGEWTYDGPPRGDCWVPRSASKIWVAYSEYHWPPEFFEKAHNEAFRKQIMTPVLLRGQNQWAAFVGDAVSLVEEYKDPASIDPLVRARLAQSQTGFASYDWHPKLDESNKECVAVVAVHDPVGDVAEMYYRSAMIQEHHLDMSTEYLYPLTIGQFCKGIKAGVKPRDGVLNRLLPSIFNGPALDPGWEAEYDGIKSMVEARLAFLKDLAAGITVQMNDQSDHMLGKLMQLAIDAAEASDKPVPELAEYLWMLQSTALFGLGCSQEGINILRNGLGGAEIVPPGSVSIDKWISKARTVWGGLNKLPFEKLRRSQYSFHLAFEALAAPLGMEMARGGQSIAMWQDALNAGLARYEGDRLTFGTRTVSWNDAISFLQGHTDPYSGSPMEVLMDKVDGAGELKVRRMVDAGASADVPFIVTRTEMRLVGGIGAENLIIKLDGMHQVAGLFLSAWALNNAVFAYKSTPNSYQMDKFTELTLTREFQLASAATSVAGAIHSTHKLLKKVAETADARLARMSTDALTTLYQGAVTPGSRVANGVNASLRASIRAGDIAQTRAIIGKRLAVHGLAIAGYIFGAVASAGSMMKGYHRKDNAEMVGNAMMLIGGLMMIPGAGWVLAGIGAIILAIGFLISLYSYDALEDIARQSFWGTDDEYWDGDRPLTKRQQVEMSAGMGAPYDKHFQNELALFAELSWAPVLSNPSDGDNEILVRSGAIPVIGTENISVEATISVLSPKSDMLRTVPIPFGIRRIPGTDAMAIKLEENRPQGITPGVQITVKVRGPRSGYEPPKASKFFRNP